MRKIYFFTILILLFSLTLFGNSSFAQTIKLGWTGPLSGPAAEAGIAMKQGAILALEEWNGKGGIYISENKKKILAEIIFEDCQSKPEVGVSVAEKLITRDKVHLLLSDAFHSSVTMATMELAPKYGIPMMSIIPTSDEIAKKVASNPSRYWSFWKGWYGTDGLGRTIYYNYKQLIEQKEFIPKNKTIASLVEDTDYGRRGPAIAIELFEKEGWKNLTMETVPLGHTDFYPQLTKIKALGPDILVTNYTSLASGVATVKQFFEIGLQCAHYAIYYPVRPEFISMVGKQAEYLLWNPMNFDPINIPSHKEFAGKISKRWNVSTTYDHLYAYEGINNALDSIERAGSLEPKNIVDALSKLNRKALNGRYVFDQSNHQIKDGPEFIMIGTAQIIEGKHTIIWPPAVAVKKYYKQPWIK